jgi:hypothetical protein
MQKLPAWQVWGHEFKPEYNSTTIWILFFCACHFSAPVKKYMKFYNFSGVKGIFSSQFQGFTHGHWPHCNEVACHGGSMGLRKLLTLW